MDRSHYAVRKLALSDRTPDRDYAGLSAEERLAMVWTVTVQAWMFKEGRLDQPRLRRDVVRILRKGS